MYFALNIVWQGLAQRMVDQSLERNQESGWQKSVIPIKDNACLMRLWLSIRRKPDLLLVQFGQHACPPVVWFKLVFIWGIGLFHQFSHLKLTN